jgi:hypothetical protein
MIIQNKLPEHYCELSYVQLIQEQLLKEFDDNYSLYFIHPDLDVIEGVDFGEKIKNDTNYKIAFHTGNEVAYSPQYYDFFDIIFRVYLQENCDYEKIFPINLGFNSSGQYGIYPNKGNKLSERTNDVFFMGNKSVRFEFYEAINNLSDKYDITFTDGFRTGLPIKDYYDKLSNSKICLAPNGYSPETFRYNEALGSGCIVITKERVNSWFYENSTAIFIDDWSEVTEEFINNILLSDIDKKYEENLDYYKKCLSPEANAEYIIKTIKEKKIN